MSVTLRLQTTDQADDAPPANAALVSMSFMEVGPEPVFASGGPVTVGAAAPTQTLYLTERGDSTAISVNDLHQGQIGDCFLISSIGELALFHPTAISNMIHVNANGTETVTLYTASSGKVAGFGATAFKPIQVAVDNVFPTNSVNNGATQDVVGNQKEIWPQVIEKAVATLDGGYGAIASGGNPMIAMQELSGRAAMSLSPSSLTAATLQSLSAAGDLIVMDTSSKGNLPYGLVSNHAYMFEKLTTVSGAAMVQLGNPWGTNQPSLIPLAQLSKAIVEVDVGRFT